MWFGANVLKFLSPLLSGTHIHNYSNCNDKAMGRQLLSQPKPGLTQATLELQ